MAKQRPIGWEGKPIPKGMLYSDYTPEQIEAAVTHPEFESRCKRAQERADQALASMCKKADQQKKGVMTGIELIAVERQRQVDVEGWTPKHDDEHKYGELAQAAQAYCYAAIHQAVHGADDMDFLKLLPNSFPKNWVSEWWKPSPDPIRNLVKAGALIAAEIDRIQRLP
jgi:hypothetical protein